MASQEGESWTVSDYHVNIRGKFRNNNNNNTKNNYGIMHASERAVCGGDT